MHSIYEQVSKVNSEKQRRHIPVQPSQNHETRQDSGPTKWLLPKGIKRTQSISANQRFHNHDQDSHAFAFEQFGLRIVQS